MGMWFSNLVELIKIKVAVSCVNWELWVNLVVGLGKGLFFYFLCWWVAPSRGKPACSAQRRALLLLGWLCSRCSVKPRDRHTHTSSQTWPCEHGKHPCSLGLMPGNSACWEGIFRSEKRLPSQTFIVPALWSLVSLAVSKYLHRVYLVVLKRKRHLKLRNKTVSFIF